MPWGDRTGPEGRGPMTGRGLGFCAGYNRPGFVRGVPRGRPRLGRGRMMRRMPRRPMPEPVEAPLRRSAELSDADKKEIIEDEIKNIEQDLKELKKELKELK